MITRNYIDSRGNPEGGEVIGTGITIVWQKGPLGRGTDRKEPNGAFVEDVIKAAISRLEFYQESKFACQHNEAALEHLKLALAVLNTRTQEREARGVEGENLL